MRVPTPHATAAAAAAADYNTSKRQFRFCGVRSLRLPGQRVGRVHSKAQQQHPEYVRDRLKPSLKSSIMNPPDP